MFLQNLERKHKCSPKHRAKIKFFSNTSSENTMFQQATDSHRSQFSKLFTLSENIFFHQNIERKTQFLSKTLNENAIGEQNLARKRSFWAKPRTKTQFLSKTSSENATFEQNLGRKRNFWAKPRAKTQFLSKMQQQLSLACFPRTENGYTWFCHAMHKSRDPALTILLSC